MAGSEGGKPDDLSCSSDPRSAWTFSFPPTGGRRVGTAPSFTGRGGGRVVFSQQPKQCAAYPAHRVFDPPTSPPHEGRGRSWGEGGGSLRRTACPFLFAHTSAGVTAADVT